MDLWRMFLRWLQDHPYKFGVSVVTGVVLAIGAYGYLAVQSALAEASETFDAASAAEGLTERSQVQFEENLEDFLVSEEVRLREEYAQQLAGAELDAQIQRQIDDLTAEIRANQFEVPFSVSPPLPDEMFTSILLIGADASGFLADVIIYVLLPSDGSAPMLVSLPRDLYVPNECIDQPTRLNAGLGGCKGFASGPELLALNVGSFTGVTVDHYARVNFNGFAALVDRLGGVSICVGDRQVRDQRAHLDPIGPGCLWVDGQTALAWVRSRHPEYLVGEEWVEEGGSDFTRQRRQQDVLLQFAESLRQYSSLSSLTTALNNLSSVVRLDEGFTVSQAASIAFRYRSLDRSDVVRLRLPVEDYRTSYGAWVLVPTRTFHDVLVDAYPPAALG